MPGPQSCLRTTDLDTYISGTWSQKNVRACALADCCDVGKFWSLRIGDSISLCIPKHWLHIDNIVFQDQKFHIHLKISAINLVFYSRSWRSPSCVWKWCSGAKCALWHCGCACDVDKIKIYLLWVQNLKELQVLLLRINLRVRSSRVAPDFWWSRVQI